MFGWIMCAVVTIEAPFAYSQQISQTILVGGYKSLNSSWVPKEAF